jgi:hypothetical protein
MATQLQLRRGNTAQTAVFTGVIAEVTVDTDQKTLTIHDGTTVGGNYLITKSQLESNVSIIAGINSTQNTNITAVNGFAAGAFNTANGANGLAAGAFNKANTNADAIAVIQGVNLGQNTTITEVNQFAAAAYATANNKFNSSGGTISGNVNVTGNLSVTGTTFYANTEQLLVKDNIITLNSNVTGVPTLDAGIEINRGSETNTVLKWSETDHAWKFTNDGTNFFRIADTDRVNSAFSLANTNASNITIIQGVDLTQNSAISIIQGVDLAQNTNITAVNQYAQSSFGVANSALTLAQNAYNYANTISVLTNNTASFSLESNGIIILPALSALYNNTATFSTSTANQIFDTFSTTEYRTAKYLIQGVSGIDVHSTEVILNHNDTNVFMLEYGTVYSSSILFNLDSYIISGNVILDITPVETDTTIDFVRTSLVARILSGIEGDLMTQSGTDDLNIGSGTEDLNI